MQNSVGSLSPFISSTGPRLHPSLLPNSLFSARLGDYFNQTKLMQECEEVINFILSTEVKPTEQQWMRLCARMDQMISIYREFIDDLRNTIYIPPATSESIGTQSAPTLFNHQAVSLANIDNPEFKGEKRSLDQFQQGEFTQLPSLTSLPNITLSTPQLHSSIPSLANVNNISAAAMLAQRPIKRNKTSGERKRNCAKDTTPTPTTTTTTKETKETPTTTNQAETPKSEHTPEQPDQSQKKELANLFHPSKYKSDKKLQCEVCYTTETPEWRRGPNGKRTLCNACGLQYAKFRRQEQIKPNWHFES